jgi:hypothetical protein
MFTLQKKVAPFEWNGILARLKSLGNELSEALPVHCKNTHYIHTFPLENQFQDGGVL